MMTRIQIIGLTIVATFGLSAIVTASAFAEAEMTAEGGGAAKGITFTSKSEPGTDRLFGRHRWKPPSSSARQRRARVPLPARRQPKLL